ncbi:hypothetical protein CHS0354_009100 [Potamilus streckersoni]|uniref:Protein kinase domain-containing protein n=1 Tax=Potamilus streckersoni TaxID=2493646 RepID=A0AAE0WDG2_9BIVA|nr:hypothetical protein CHS0354_009100 [Potamilus streckersoni]
MDELDITISKIDNLCDVIDALDFCDRYNVPCEKLCTVEELKNRLRLHYRKLTWTSSPKVLFEKSVQEIAKENEKKRIKLIEMIDGLKKCFMDGNLDLHGERHSSLVEDLLKTEGTTMNITEDCDKMMKNLQKGHFTILVSGETSAGKSSVLNLLLGNNMLPTDTRSSTSVITTIGNRRRNCAKILYKSGKVESIPVLDEYGIKRLKEVAFMEDDSSRQKHDISEVQVSLPIPLTKAGFVFVDSPGIGENEFLENLVIDYIARTEIQGFMYVIKTDAAGGVQEDRLMNLLRIVLEHHKVDNSIDSETMKCDPKSAIFVCNRFDLVKEDEREMVRQHVISQLSKCWPDLHPSQVIFFSTMKVQDDIEADPEYINDNYILLMETLKKLYVHALENKIKSTYRWIESILRRCVHHLRGMVKRLDRSERENMERSAQARNKLAVLRNKADDVIMTLRADLEIAAKTVCGNIRTHLKDTIPRMRLTTCWTLDELPSSEGGKWSWIKDKIDDAFFDRMGSLIEEWDEKNGVIKMIEEKIIEDTRMRLSSLQHELAEMEKEIQDDSSSDGSNRLSMSRRSSLLPMSLVSFAPFKIRDRIDTPKLPIRMAVLFVPKLQTIIENNHLNEYKENPSKYATERSKKLLKALFKSESTVNENSHFEDVLLHFAEKLLERPQEYIRRLEEKIPGMILANELMLKRFEESTREERKFQNQYIEMMTQIERLRRSLMDYGEGNIFVADFKAEEIVIKETTGEGESINKTFKVSDILHESTSRSDRSKGKEPGGLWTISQNAFLCKAGYETAIVLRMYLPSSGINETFQEVAKLRCLITSETNLASFLGIHHSDSSVPAYIYGGPLRSVRRYLFNAIQKPKEIIPNILKGTVIGLNYLHQKGLVHMELTQDTITIDEDGDVKLTGACLPRLATLPLEKDIIQAGDFVYLPPEVLTGDLYISSSDMYSLGLFILEVLARNSLEQGVFGPQKKWTLSEFVRKVDTSSMLELEKHCNIVSKETLCMISRLLLSDEDRRPTANEVYDFIPHVESEDKVFKNYETPRNRLRAFKRKSQDKKVS